MKYILAVAVTVLTVLCADRAEAQATSPPDCGPDCQLDSTYESSEADGPVSYPPNLNQTEQFGPYSCALPDGEGFGDMYIWAAPFQSCTQYIDYWDGECVPDPGTCPSGDNEDNCPAGGTYITLGEVKDCQTEWTDNTPQEALYGDICYPADWV